MNRLEATWRKEWNPKCGRPHFDPLTKQEIAEPLTAKEAAVIDHVWSKYKDFSPAQLSRLTHEPDTPWSKAYFERGRNAALSNKDIKEHYVQLALAGRADD